MQYLTKLKAITLNLEKCNRVMKHSTTDENQADTLANAFIDIEKSGSKILNELIPRLYSEELTEEKIDMIILDIGEELRHIVYHINDTKVYDYLKSEE